MVDEDTLEEYVDLVLAGADQDALTVALALADAGTSVAAILTGLVGVSQARVGLAWESGHASVAQEHAASAINHNVLRTLAERIPPGRKGPIALACVQHNWHSLPAAILEQLLRLHGWRVDFLGASLPPDALISTVRDHDYMALALSCTLPGHLWEAARVIDAAHAAGMRVLVGGSAFGSDHRRADVLGADGWAASADAADAILTRWLADVHGYPRPYARPWNHEPGTLRTQRAAILAAALASAQSTLAATTGDDQQAIAPDAEAFDQLLAALIGALICHDDRVLLDLVAWMQHLLTTQQHASGVLMSRLHALLGALEPSLRNARALLGRAIDQLAGTTSVSVAPDDGLSMAACTSPQSRAEGRA